MYKGAAIGLFGTITSMGSMMTTSNLLMVESVRVQTGILMILIEFCVSYSFYLFGSHLGKILIKKHEDEIREEFGEFDDSNSSAIIYSVSRKSSFKSQVSNILPPRKKKIFILIFNFFF